MMRAGIRCGLFVVWIYSFASPAQAQVVTDGSMGAPTTLSGPTYFIDAALGQQRGANLFHSFSSFNIQSGQNAIFDSTPSATNIIARVTGGNSSTINGAVTANANLFLINPQGILFGANATLNVNGSFHASTAQYLKFADGTRFYADLGASSVLSIAAPSAFGFLTGDVAPIVSQDNLLTVPDSQSLSLIGGGVTVSNARFSVPNGRINLAAVASPGEVALQPNSLSLSGFTKLSDVQFSHGAVNVDNEGAASVFIRGGRFVMENQSTIAESTFLPGAPRAIDIDVDSMQLRGSAILTTSSGGGAATYASVRARQLEVSDGGVIQTTAAGPGAGGGVAIVADDVRINGVLSVIGTAATMSSGRGGDVSIQSKSLSVSGGTISTVTNTAGAGGAIEVNADSIALTDGGTVISTATSAGSGGRIAIQSRALSIDGSQSALATGIGSTTASSAANAADGGSIAIDVDSFSARRGFVSSGTSGPGQSGDITLNARNLSLENAATIAVDTGIASDVGPLATFGPGGAITISAQSARVLSGSRINTNTLGGGAGGSIAITANQLTIDQTGSTATTGIASNSGSSTVASVSGAGGKIVLRVEDIQMRNHGVISSNAYGSGSAGRIDIAGGTLAMSDDASIGASSFGLLPTAGRANDIVLNVDSLDVSDNAQIANTTSGAGSAGKLLIAAKTVRIADGAVLQASSLSGAANSGAAGDILINADEVQIDGASVSARSFGAALSGGITIGARIIKLDNGAVLSATGVGSGNAGNITVDAFDSVTLTRGSRIVTEALNGSGGNIALLAENKVLLRDSVVSTSVLGAASNGGNVSIDPVFVIIDNGQIIARAVGGNGGNINIATRYLLQSEDSAVDASSRLGISGRVKVFGANVDLNSDIAPLPVDFLNAKQWLAVPCASRQGNDVSQFTVNARDGAYRSPQDFGPSPLIIESPPQEAGNRPPFSKPLDLAQVSFVPVCLSDPG